MLIAAPVLLTLATLAPPKLADAAWLVGQWRNAADEKSAFEEHWTAPAGGSMTGMFRLGPVGGPPRVHEFLLLEESAEGVTMLLRHYGPGMRDVDKEPIRLRLTEASDSQLVFTPADGGDKPKRVVYARTGDQLTVTVETSRDGNPTTFTLRFVRVGGK